MKPLQKISAATGGVFEETIRASRSRQRGIRAGAQTTESAIKRCTRKMYYLNKYFPSIAHTNTCKCFDVHNGLLGLSVGTGGAD